MALPVPRAIEEGQLQSGLAQTLKAGPGAVLLSGQDTVVAHGQLWLMAVGEPAQRREVSAVPGVPVTGREQVAKAAQAWILLTD